MDSMDSILPVYLKANPTSSEDIAMGVAPSPDSTTNPEQLQQLQLSTPTKAVTTASPEPDLVCSEILLEELDSLDSSSSSSTKTVTSAESPSRSDSPLSAVDIFTDFNTNVLQVYEDEAEAAKASSIDPTYSILVS